MSGPQFSLKSLLWSMAVVSLLLAQFSVLDRIWAAFSVNETPIMQLACLPLIWATAYLLFRRG